MCSAPATSCCTDTLCTLKGREREIAQCGFLVLCAALVAQSRRLCQHSRPDALLHLAPAGRGEPSTFLAGPQAAHPTGIHACLWLDRRTACPRHCRRPPCSALRQARRMRQVGRRVRQCVSPIRQSSLPSLKPPSAFESAHAPRLRRRTRQIGRQLPAVAWPRNWPHRRAALTLHAGRASCPARRTSQLKCLPPPWLLPSVLSVARQMCGTDLVARLVCWCRPRKRCCVMHVVPLCSPDIS
jgi:hypothetical protein